MQKKQTFTNRTTVPTKTTETNKKRRIAGTAAFTRTVICFGLLSLSLTASAAVAESTKVTPPDPSPATEPALEKTTEATDFCLNTVNEVVRAPNRERLKSFCQRVRQLRGCTSVEGRMIQHADSSSDDIRGKRILVLGMIHGDEPLAGEMALEWAERLERIPHRNQWRVVPMINPDGLKRKTRMNANGVDLNRNFPTKDWLKDAISYWKKTAKSDPRRFPGSASASEPETKCVINHIKDFRPDFIVSVHTPYEVLDFDGPKMTFPRYRDLPWRALGNFPGSLGRFMWRDYQVPVLTVELGSKMVDAAQLQDIVGTFAIEVSKKNAQRTAALFDRL